MRRSLLLVGLAAALLTTGCEDAKTKSKDKPAATVSDDAIGKSGIKTQEDFIADVQKRVTPDNLDATVSKLEDEILHDTKK